MHYNVGLVILSVVIAVVTGTVALLAALRLDTLWSAILACLIMGVAVSGMHYTGIAALHVYAATGSAGMAGSGSSASSFLLPLIIGISIVTMVMTGALSLSPTKAELRKEAELFERIARNHGRQAAPDALEGPQR
jgi:NO-binding membrane sensor protein with MHYT domain